MKKQNLLLFLCFLLFAFNNKLIAEGTKQLAPNPDDRVFLFSNVSQYGNFAQYDGTEAQRLYIHINDPENEQVFLGFSQAYNSGHYPCEGIPVDAYFRIVDPNGVVVYPIRGNASGQILTTSTVNITSKDQPMNGPNQIVGNGGYDAFVFNPTGLSAGDYYIELSREQATATPDLFIAIEWWDITVATKDNTPTAINGRVYSKNWALMSPSISCGTDPVFAWFDRAFNGSFYIYTNEGIVSKTDFNNSGLQTAAFNVFFNDFGTMNTGNTVQDRKSLLNQRTTEAQHRIFLNDPDINIYPSGTLGIFSLIPRFLECDDGRGCFKISVTEPGQIDVLIDIDKPNGDFLYDRGTRDRILAFKVEPEFGEAPPYIRCIPWDGLDAFGQTIADDVLTELLVRYAQGIYHFPIYDAEFLLRGFTPTTIRPSNIQSPMRIYYDDRNITFNSGSPEDNEDSFNSCLAPCHTWTNKEFGDNNTINTWFFAREKSQREIERDGCPIEAINDTSITTYNTAIDIPILMNDLGGVEINEDFLNFGDLAAQNGTVSLVSDTLNYIPNIGFIGEDSLQYVICLDIIPLNALCDTAKVFITVLPADNEDCSNGFDDDGDGDLDCDDPDCLPSKPQGIFRKG